MLIDLNIHIKILNQENDTYVFESVCELLQASFLNFTIENSEKTENGRNKNIILRMLLKL